MKILLLLATLLVAASVIAAPDAPTAPPQNPFAVPLSPYDELVNASRAQFEAKDFAGAQKNVEAMLAIAKTPKEKSDALRRLGQTLDAQEQYDKARELWKQALPLAKESSGDLTELNLLIGQSYYKQENWQSYLDSALPLLDVFRADEGTSKSAFRLQLAEAYSKLEQQDKAREQLALVVQDETLPGDLRGLAQLNLAENYREADEDDKARPLYEALTKIPEVSGDLLIGAYEGLGEIAQKQNRAEDAKTALTGARHLWIEKAQGQYKAQEWAGAIQSYKRALATGTPEMGVAIVAHMQIGMASRDLKNYDEARAEFQTVIDTNPTSITAEEKQLLALLKPGAYIESAKTDIAQQKFESARVTLNAFLQIKGDAGSDVAAQIFRKQAENLLQDLPPAP